MFEDMQEMAFILLLLGGTMVGGFVGGVIAIYWTRREE